LPKQSLPSIRTILFDLDGTLLDTAPDLADALNKVRQENGLEPLPYEVIRPKVSHGSKGLMEVGFDFQPGTEKYEKNRLRLLEIYSQHLADKTRLFPGMSDLLDRIERRGMNWGVVTNKPAWLTDPLMDALQLTKRASCIISGDSTTNRKPHPDPMLHACELAGSNINECIYIGDAQRDIEAGRNAGMKTLVALFGYIDKSESPEDWQADHMINTPDEILDWIERQALQGNE
jgi:2-phosphoglycolate phosphatase